MKKYHIITYGCQMNKSTSERIATLLEKRGYQPAENESSADLLVINACSVRQKPIDKIKNQIAKIKRINQKAKIILTGCVLEADKKAFEKLGVMIKQFKGLEKIKPRVGYVPIIEGCNNFCTYCVVPYTRGRERCRPPKEIICQVKHLIKRGVKEITLLGQNVNSYKYKLKTQNSKLKTTTKNLKLNKLKIIDFADLLRVINALPGDFKIRFLTSNPKDMTDKLIKTIAQCEKIEKYVHLPVQSGDNDVLRKMNRGYTRERYLVLVKKIRQKIPNVKLTTDIIVGFPGETEEQFQNTVDLVKKVGYEQMYVAKYSPRPGTEAYFLKDDLPIEEKKRREKILREL